MTHNTTHTTRNTHETPEEREAYLETFTTDRDGCYGQGTYLGE